MSSSILFFSNKPDLHKKLEVLFEFLDTTLISVSSLEELDTISTTGNIHSSIIHNEDEKITDIIVSKLHAHIPSSAIFILSRHDIPIDHSTSALISGYLTLPLKYNKLLPLITRNDLTNSETQINTVIKAAKQSTLTPVNSMKIPTLAGCSPQMKEIQVLIQHVSVTDANVLILGESGTGKEVVARNIHSLSLRKDRPFVAVNCGAIPAELLESELFGHEKGSFTGAINMRKGRFELAEGGTLFLDEIGDMPYEMQVKLLRVIQEKTFERVGGNKSITSNIRIIAATHQDLENKISDGKFRMDLYYRLNVFPIELEPLRNRPDDIEFLINEFLSKMRKEYKDSIEMDSTAIQALQAHSLPGNVRELENLIERLAILYPGESISSKQLPMRYQKPITVDSCEDTSSSTISVTPFSPEIDKVHNLKQYLTDLEKTIIVKALNDSNGIVAKAAKSLTLQRTTLVEKIKKLDIQQSM